eukprot:609392-Pleurochrysis_carterae.AAC.1
MNVPRASAVDYETNTTLTVAQVTTAASSVATRAGGEHNSRWRGERCRQGSLDGGIPNGGGIRA